MKKPRTMASAKPGQHKVQVGRKTYVFARVRKKEYFDTLYGLNLIHFVAKETLRRVKEIFNIKN